MNTQVNIGQDSQAAGGILHHLAQTMCLYCVDRHVIYRSGDPKKLNYWMNTLRLWLTAVALFASALTAHAQAAASNAVPNTADKATLLVLGDSLSAEYGLPRNTGWVKLLADRLTQQGAQVGSQYNVVNASISGETTSGGRTRLPALLAQYKPAIVIVQLGGNDGLRGLQLNAMRSNLLAMIDATRKANANVLLVGIQIPPNYGRDYAERFYRTYADIAREAKVPLAPFLLEGFAEKAEIFQPDRIHPREAAQPLMLENVWPHLKPLLPQKKR
jgi:acyl-CoA thioesterase I